MHESQKEKKKKVKCKSKATSIFPATIFFIYRKTYVLMISYSFARTTIWILADLGEYCAFEDLSHICVPLELITFLLPGSQVTAHKAKACLVQCHAY